MDKPAETVELAQVIKKKNGVFATPDEQKFMDNFIIKQKSQPVSKDETIKLIDVIQAVTISDITHLKILQLLRMLTKSP